MIKFSAGGFRDFTRIAASDPTMWRDVLLTNKDAVLEMLGTFTEDLSKLTRAIRRGDGEALFELFTRTRAIRRGIVEIGQDLRGARLRPPARASGEAGVSVIRWPCGETEAARHGGADLRSDAEQPPASYHVARVCCGASSKTKA